MTSASVANFVRRNPSARAATELLDEAGVPWTLVFGGKHPKLHFTFGGRNHVHPVAFSPSDPSAFKSAARDIRRVLASQPEAAEQPQEPAMADTRQPVTVQEIDFHGATLRTFEADGQKWVVMRPIVEAMGLSWPAQYKKLMTDQPWWGTLPYRYVGGETDREMVCLPLRSYPMWLATISPRKIPDAEVRARIELYQGASVEALYQFWTRGEATVESVAEALGDQQQERQQAPGDDDLSAMLGLMQEQFDRLAAAVAERQFLTEDDMRRLLRQHCEWERRQHGRLRDEVHAGAGRVIKTLRNEPVSASLGDDVDLDAGYRACGIEGPIPARRKLSARVTNMVDAYCRKHRIPVGQIVVRGAEVKVWPRAAFRDWYSEEGSAFIGEHIRRATAGGHQARPGEPNVVDLFSPQPGAR